MCGIAGIIHRDGPGDIGSEMTRMLQSMKHRGPDSSGFALYGPPADLFVMRFKLADPNEDRGLRLGRPAGTAPRRGRAPAGQDRRRRSTRVAGRARSTRTGSRFRYSGDLKPLADYVEDVPGCEVLSLGHSLEIVKDLSDAESVAERYKLAGFTGTHAIGHVRMATESDVDISGAHPYWAYPFSDIAVVHNGQLTNYHMWRRRLERIGPPVPVRVRLRDHRRLPGPEDGRRAVAGDRDEAEPRRAGRRLHLPGGHRRRARRGQGRDGRQAAGAVRVAGTGRAGLRGGRDPRRHRPRDRHLRPVRARSAGVDTGEDQLRRPRPGRARRRGPGDRDIEGDGDARRRSSTPPTCPPARSTWSCAAWSTTRASPT